MGPSAFTHILTHLYNPEFPPIRLSKLHHIPASENPPSLGGKAHPAEGERSQANPPPLPLLPLLFPGQTTQ